MIQTNAMLVCDRPAVCHNALAGARFDLLPTLKGLQWILCPAIQVGDIQRTAVGVDVGNMAEN